MGDVYHAKWNLSVDGVTSDFGLFYEQTAGGTGGVSARDAAVSIQDAQLTPLQNILSSAARVESIYVRKITGTSAPAWRGNLQNAVGSQGANAVTAQNCLLVNLRNSTGLLKRSGRLFVSGTPADKWTLGVIDGLYVSVQLAVWIGTLMTVPPGGGSPWAGFLIVWKKVTNGVPNVPPLQVPIDAIDVTDTLGTQHQRKGIFTGFEV